MCAQSCPTLCDFMDCSQPWTNSSVLGIFQARILEWDWSELPFPAPANLPDWGIQPTSRIPALAGNSLPAEPLGKPKVKVKVTQLCPTLWNPIDYTFHGILQARILEWVAFPFFRGSSQPRNQTQGSCIIGGSFTSGATRGAHFLIKRIFKQVFFKIGKNNWDALYIYTYIYICIYICIYTDVDFLIFQEILINVKCFEE